jgi:hypothetical protein
MDDILTSGRERQQCSSIRRVFDARPIGGLNWRRVKLGIRVPKASKLANLFAILATEDE